MGNGARREIGDELLTGEVSSCLRRAGAACVVKALSLFLSPRSGCEQVHCVRGRRLICRSNANTSDTLQASVPLHWSARHPGTTYLIYIRRGARLGIPIIVHGDIW
ncbi:unnamed protein product, partial [Iphiclides podalirius]